MSAAIEATAALLEHGGTQSESCREPMWPVEGGAWASDLLLYITDHKTKDGHTCAIFVTSWSSQVYQHEHNKDYRTKISSLQWKDETTVFGQTLTRSL